MKNKYIVSCGGWQVIESGKDSDEAATKALEKMIKLKGEDLRVFTFNRDFVPLRYRVRL